MNDTDFMHESLRRIKPFFPTKESTQRHLYHDDAARACPVCAFLFKVALPVWERYGGNTALRESLERATEHMTSGAEVTDETVEEAMRDGTLIAAWHALEDDVTVLLDRYQHEEPDTPDWQLRAHLAAGLCMLVGLGDDDDGVLPGDEGMAKPAALLLVAMHHALTDELNALVMQHVQQQAGLHDN